MFSKRIILSLTVFLFSLILANTAFAGFGISPPYVQNENLAKGSHYQEKIIIVRDNAFEDWKVNLEISLPGAENWITIDKGTEFIFSKNETQSPILVNIDVPKDAKLGSYKGYIRVKTTAIQQTGTVGIALGGRIEIDLDVVNAKIFDFKIHGVKVADLEEGHKLWLFYIPGKIKFSMQMENIGNIKSSPTKVYFDIFDEQEIKILETLQITKMEKVNPFETKWITAELSTKLPPGSYWAKYKIYKNDLVVNDGKVHLSVLPYGTLPKETKDIRIFGLNIWVISLIALAVLSGFLLAILKIIKKIKR